MPYVRAAGRSLACEWIGETRDSTPWYLPRTTARPSVRYISRTPTAPVPSEMTGSVSGSTYRWTTRGYAGSMAYLERSAARRQGAAAFLGVFAFTLLMITREGMETALLLLQIKNQSQLLLGALIGLAAATLLALAWARYGHLINLKRFFQVTSLFLVLFLAQVAIYTFHEFSEAGLLPNSEALHTATEVWSPDGKYGQWFSLLIVISCMLWLIVAYIADRARKSSEVNLTSGTPRSVQ